MKTYILSLLIGVMVGVIYGLLGMRSPAPPVIALIGLLGMLMGEQIPPFIKHNLPSGLSHWVHPLNRKDQP